MAAILHGSQYGKDSNLWSDMRRNGKAGDALWASWGDHRNEAE